ncbi:MAG: anthranilate phosphoribosyltransferase [Candidatus Micrarchaeota archaeon]|nr:anthranilate phosphoribosyltransferase [Candidatus Micrarchaeota archaeon]
MIEEAIKRLVDGASLSETEARDSVREIMSGRATPVQMAAFLAALKTKGEAVDEIVGAAKVMRGASVKVNPGVECVDTCGTGGDKIKTFNVSTLAAITAVASGVRVAKHGNRSFTGKCGSADILEALGVKIDLGPREVEKMIRTTGFGFMFAPLYHPAMKAVAPVRKELGIRTIFNLIGPLCSPASAKNQVMGVFAPEYVDVVAKAMVRLGIENALVVHGMDGIDEISTVGSTRAARVRKGKVSMLEMVPRDFGAKKAAISQVRAGKTVEENAKIALDVLSGKKQTATDVARLELCAANAGAVLVVAGKASDFKKGFVKAMETLESGAPLEKLVEVAAASGGDVGKITELKNKFL